MNDFIIEICELLQISVPNVSHNLSVLSTSTQMAAYDPETDTLHYPDREPDPDLYFAVAHELRHVWQKKYYPDTYFADYIPRDRSDNIISYNNQVAEIDAHAFGTIVMISMFRLKPKFDGFSVPMINNIYKRADQIYQEEFNE